MRDVVFEWDSEKSSLNEKKHGVTFEEASSVFYDVNALVIADTEHSIDEDRFLILGMSTRLRMVVVCHCYRETMRLFGLFPLVRRMQGRYRNMKDSYDFSNGVKNPYISKLPKQQVTIRLDVASVQYFKEMAARSGISYQNIINLYLADCVKERREIAVSFT